MKDHLAELVRTSPTTAHGRNVTREYLQARILSALQRAGAISTICCGISAIQAGPRRIWLCSTTLYNRRIGRASR